MHNIDETMNSQNTPYLALMGELWGVCLLWYLGRKINVSLQWRHNGRESVSYHQPHDCLLNRLFRRRSKKTSMLRVTGLCAGNSLLTGEFPAQMASNAENVSIWWRHHVMKRFDGAELKSERLFQYWPNFSPILAHCGSPRFTNTIELKLTHMNEVNGKCAMIHYDLQYKLFIVYIIHHCMVCHQDHTITLPQGPDSI